MRSKVGSVFIHPGGLFFDAFGTLNFFSIQPAYFSLAFLYGREGGIAPSIPHPSFLVRPQFPFLSLPLAQPRADPFPRLGQSNPLNLEQVRQSCSWGSSNILEPTGAWWHSLATALCCCPATSMPGSGPQCPVCSSCWAPTLPVSSLRAELTQVAFSCWQPAVLTHSYLSGRTD